MRSREAAAQKSIDEHAKIKTERERLIASAASMEATLEVMRANLDRKRGFERTRADKRKRYDILADIYKLVSGDKFIEYVAEEYILQFTSAASAVLSDITGGKYTLTDATLTPSMPLGVSNEPLVPPVTVFCRTGMLLVTWQESEKEHEQ